MGASKGNRHEVPLAPREVYKLFRGWGWEEMPGTGSKTKMEWHGHVVAIPAPTLAKAHHTHRIYITEAARAMNLTVEEFLAGPRSFVKNRHHNVLDVINESDPQAIEEYGPETILAAGPAVLAKALARIKHRETAAERRIQTIPPFAFEDEQRCFTPGCVYAEGHDPDQWPHQIDIELLPVAEEPTPSPAPAPAPLAQPEQETTMNRGPSEIAPIAPNVLSILQSFVSAASVDQVHKACVDAGFFFDHRQVNSALLGLVRKGSIERLSRGYYRAKGPVAATPVFTPVPISAAATPAPAIEKRHAPVTLSNDELWDHLHLIFDGEMPRLSRVVLDAVSVWMDATRELFRIKAKQEEE